MYKTQTTKHTLREVTAILALFCAVIIAGVIFYHRVEGLAWVDAIYFTSVTLTTVGYGDFAPQTDAGKLFTSVYSFLGIGAFFGIAGILFHGMIDYSRGKSATFRKRGK